LVLIAVVECGVQLLDHDVHLVGAFSVILFKFKL
jgi:hypothetical protein